MPRSGGRSRWALLWTLARCGGGSDPPDSVPQGRSWHLRRLDDHGEHCRSWRLAASSDSVLRWGDLFLPLGVGAVSFAIGQVVASSGLPWAVPAAGALYAAITGTYLVMRVSGLRWRSALVGISCPARMVANS